jgi:chromosome segregation ATPase
MNRLLIMRYQEHEDLEVNLEDEENCRSSRDCRRYTEQIERLEQQLEDLRLDYALASSELHNLRRNRDSYHDEAREAEAGLHRQQGEVTQREGVITMLTDQVDKMRSESSWRNSAASAHR